ncbi:MAG: hypothetical protein A2Y17_12205 [Clostridiales bacterium GWF2_38_85]|nr:MAG: hypothetical protein A2Y17_12205 [Clostridiales bacterium GWF2_38_85]
MTLYKTKRPSERLSARRIRNGQVLRIARGGYSLHINIYRFKRAGLRLLKRSLIIAGTLLLFKIGQAAAYTERGYKAYGGEMLILLLPLIAYVIKQNIKDTAEAYRTARDDGGSED